MNKSLPSIQSAKEQARQLRGTLARRGETIGHAAALERVAQDHGFRDWNAMSAAIGNRSPEVWGVGQRISGTYLNQRFSGQVVSVEQTRPDWFRLDVQFDEAIDVVTSEAFRNLRSRVRVVIGPKGHSAERTSDGQPHVQLDLT